MATEVVASVDVTAPTAVGDVATGQAVEEKRKRAAPAVERRVSGSCRPGQGHAAVEGRRRLF